jgi:hypothetical protein
MEGSTFFLRVMMSWVTAVKCLRDPGWSHHSQMVVCSSVCHFLFSYVLTWYFVDTILPLSSFSISLSNFICHYLLLWETSFLRSWPIITSPISMPLFWHVKCLLSIHPHSFLQFLLFCLSCSFSLPSPALILWDFPFPFTNFCLQLFQWPQEALDSGTHMIVSCLFPF